MKFFCHFYINFFLCIDKVHIYICTHAHAYMYYIYVIHKIIVNRSGNTTSITKSSMHHNLPKIFSQSSIDVYRRALTCGKQRGVKADPGAISSIFLHFSGRTRALLVRRSPAPVRRTGCHLSKAVSEHRRERGDAENTRTSTNNANQSVRAKRLDAHAPNSQATLSWIFHPRENIHGQCASHIYRLCPAGSKPFIFIPLDDRSIEIIWQRETRREFCMFQNLLLGSESVGAHLHSK